MTTDAQLERLPKYARDEIERLRRDLQGVRRRLEAARGERKTNIIVDPFISATYIDDRDTVRYVLQSSEDFRNRYIEVELRGDTLKIRGSDILAIVPQAANVVDVKVERI